MSASWGALQCSCTINSFLSTGISGHTKEGRGRHSEITNFYGTQLENQIGTGYKEIRVVSHNAHWECEILCAKASTNT